MLFCSCSLAVLYPPAGTAHNPKPDTHCARLWMCSLQEFGAELPFLPCRALPLPLCASFLSDIVPCMSRSFLSCSHRSQEPPSTPKPTLQGEIQAQRAPCRECCCLPIPVPGWGTQTQSRKSIRALPELQLLAARWAQGWISGGHRDGFQLGQVAEGAAHWGQHQLCTKCRVGVA